MSRSFAYPGAQVKNARDSGLATVKMNQLLALDIKLKIRNRIFVIHVLAMSTCMRKKIALLPLFVNTGII